MTTYYLKGETDRQLIKNRVDHLPADGKWQVSIRKLEKRKNAQNRLLWKWNTSIAEQTYSAKEDIHAQNKLGIGVPILCRDDSNFNDAWMSISSMHGPAEQFQIIRWIDVTSIMSIKQMTEYLREMEQVYAGQGILLPKKDDEYFEALGYKRGKAA